MSIHLCILPQLVNPVLGRSYGNTRSHVTTSFANFRDSTRKAVMNTAITTTMTTTLQLLIQQLILLFSLLLLLLLQLLVLTACLPATCRCGS